MKDKQTIDQLEKIRASVKDCTRCPLHEQRNQAVFGEGPWDARIMIIGEGPGAKEDELGRPFVGRAGKLLDKLLEKQGFSREKNVFIANIVKCRPPKNRVPHKKEIESCYPYLKEQIDLINPDIILLLGATAVKSYRGESLKDKMSDIRGRWSHENGRMVIPSILQPFSGTAHTNLISSRT